MKEKITITLDVSKIDKNKIISRTFTNKSGETVTVKELKLDIIPLNETRLIKDGDTYQMFKTHFVAEQRSREEIEAKAKSKIIGEGIMFKEKKAEQDYPEEDEIDESEIPF